MRSSTTVANATATGGSLLQADSVADGLFPFASFANLAGTTTLEVDGGSGTFSDTFNFTTLTGSGNFALNATLVTGRHAIG